MSAWPSLITGYIAGNRCSRPSSETISTPGGIAFSPDPTRYGYVQANGVVAVARLP